MAETRKLAAILCSDVVGFSRLAGAEEDRTLARLRALRSDLIDPTIVVHNGRVVKRTGDGLIVEFRSVVDAVRCAIEVQNAMVERNAGVPEDRRIVFRIGIHLGDVVEESDGDLMGDGVNIAARLEGIAEPGAICLSEQAYWQVKGRLDLAVTDLGPKQLKNIAEPVRAYSLQVGVPAAVRPTTQGKAAARRKRSAKAPLALVGVVVLVALAAGAWRYLGANLAAPQSASGAPARSIVVLPLSNLSGDAAEDYLVDALTDELTTSISRLPGTFVIARNTAFTYKGKPTDVKAICKDLGVKYVLEGSVQPTTTRIRVNAQLIDGASGAHLWAESFDEERADLLQMEDDIVTRLARTLDFKMTDVEVAEARRLRPNNPDAEDLALQCVARSNNFGGAVDPVKHPEIYESCEQALRLDPGNTLALLVLAWRLVRSIILGADMTAEVERLDDLVRKALAVNSNDGNARFAKGLLTAWVHVRYDEAVVDFERAIAENPSNIGAYVALGNVFINLGQAERAVAIFDKAMRLSPHDPGLPGMLRWEADALEILGRDEEAAVLGNQALALAPNDPQILRKQAATLANLRRVAEARELYQRYAALMGGKLATIAKYRAYLFSFGGANIPRLVAWREHVLDGLHRAGMPEQ